MHGVIRAESRKRALRVRDDLYNDLEKKVGVLEKAFRVSPHKKAESIVWAKFALQDPRMAQATGILIKLRDTRRLDYGDMLASFITRLASQHRMQISNLLKGNTCKVRRMARTEVLLNRYESSHRGDMIFLPFIQEEVIISVRRKQFRNGYVPAGSVEILCEMLENPDRFYGKTFLADGDEVVVNGVRSVPSFSINAEGQWVIKPIPEKEAPKPSYRALTLLLP